VRPIAGGGTLEARLASVDLSWLREQPAPREYLARDVRSGRGAIIARGVSLLGAAGGAGKSFLTMSLAVAVATGTPWVGCMTIERPGRVLIVTAEDPREEVRRRIFEVARAQHVDEIEAGAIEVLDLHDVLFPLLDGESRATEHAAALETFVRTRGPFGLVVADPLARLAGAPIDADNVASGALISVLERLATAADGLVLAVHHTSLAARRAGDTGATAFRGATGLVDSARLAMLLSVEELEHEDVDINDRLGEIVTLRLVKKNHVSAWKPVELRRGEQGVLLPLDAQDRELVAQARASEDPQVARQEASATRTAAEDAAVLRIVGERPGISTRDLEHALRAAVHCGEQRANVAIARVLPKLATRSGPRRARLHYLPGATVPEQLKTEGA
jgi:RecA-family ATPase